MFVSTPGLFYIPDARLNGLLWSGKVHHSTDVFIYVPDFSLTSPPKSRMKVTTIKEMTTKLKKLLIGTQTLLVNTLASPP